MYRNMIRKRVGTFIAKGSCPYSLEQKEHACTLNLLSGSSQCPLSREIVTGQRKANTKDSGHNSLSWDVGI